MFVMSKNCLQRTNVLCKQTFSKFMEKQTKKIRENAPNIFAIWAPKGAFNFPNSTTKLKQKNCQNSNVTKLSTIFLFNYKKFSNLPKSKYANQLIPTISSSFHQLDKKI
eukprot:TRINITY_DN2262_c0_g2_i1.p2 TRINITY_DN2262_c0_g2~~TRINITY_DN2262_c0_g2_i1.p2  ORF type:complete len:123 (+),score=4.09 TRINITY_DN2262_c0_g2_i1:45-371(+)